MTSLLDVEVKLIDPAKLKLIRSHIEKSDILSWKRKMKKMEEMVNNDIRPIEDAILELIEKKQPFMDELAKLRIVMVESCIHPDELLVEYDDNVFFCNFCNKKLKLHG